MKKYIKPAIEIVEANLSANYLQEISGPGISGGTGSSSEGMNAPGRKRVYIEDDYEDEDFGW